jgi:hypothetical protein
MGWGLASLRPLPEDLKDALFPDISCVGKRCGPNPDGAALSDQAISLLGQLLETASGVPEGRKQSLRVQRDRSHGHGG